MNILLIRTDRQLAELYLYKNNDQLDEIKWEAHRALAETINTKLEELLRKNGLNLNQVEAIGIYKGPGSFTGLRIGHSVANALAYGLNIPIVAVEGEDWKGQSLDRILAGETDKQVIPTYGAPVHITKPKK